MVELDEKALDEFTAYFVKNYPVDTIIHNPKWHAPRIFRAAVYALRSALPEPARAGKDGWVVVPREPTQEMIAKGSWAPIGKGLNAGSLGAGNTYRAMIAAAPAPMVSAGVELPLDRDTLGRMVREAWVRWAKTQPNPKPSWLEPYDALAEPDKEADRQIGEAVAKWTMIHAEAAASLPAPTREEVLQIQAVTYEESGLSELVITDELHIYGDEIPARVIWNREGLIVGLQWRTADVRALAGGKS